MTSKLKTLKRKSTTSMNKVTLATVCFFVYGLIDLAIFALSGFSMVYIAVLGIACLVAGMGLWQSKRWGLWLAISTTPITFVAGLYTLLSWISFAGFGSNLNLLLMHLGLILYASASFFLAFYLLAHQHSFR